MCALQSMQSTYISVLRYFSLHKALLKCPLCVLDRCPSYREYSYSKITEKRQGPTPGVRLLECVF